MDDDVSNVDSANGSRSQKQADFSVRKSLTFVIGRPEPARASGYNGGSTSGGVAEWSIAPVLKTGNGQPFVSSNLTASANRPMKSNT